MAAEAAAVMSVCESEGNRGQDRNGEAAMEILIVLFNYCLSNILSNDMLSEHRSCSQGRLILSFLFILFFLFLHKSLS